MFRTMLKSRIDRATVTRTDLEEPGSEAGSVTVDPVLMDAADLLAGERIAIVDVTSGARLETYVVAGERGSGVVGVNGAATRLVHPGDTVALLAYGVMESAEAAAFRPRVVSVDQHNRIVTPAGPAPADPRPANATEPAAETADAAMLDALLQPES